MPATASDDWSRSSAIVRILLANSFCNSGAYAAPRFGSVGKSILLICMFSKTTVRATLSTWVRAVAKITPNVSSFAPVTLMASAARKSIWLPSHLLTCGW